MTLKDGTKYRSRVYEAAGEPDDPELGLEWITEKFKRITALMLEPKDQEALLDIMTNKLDTPVREVVAQINKNLKNAV